MRNAGIRFKLRKERVRRKISGSAECLRLSIYRGQKHIYAQLIDDETGNTIVHSSTMSPELKEGLKSRDTVAAAVAVGTLVAKKALEKGIKKVVLDRGGYAYKGSIKALAEAARKGGLEF
jgi:large subunit ribosomal protein L18